MHASRIKKKLQPNLQSILLDFKICTFVTKETFSKKIISIFNENTDQFCALKKNQIYIK